MPHKDNASGICEYCHFPFSYYCCPSRPIKYFCSIECSNKGGHKKIPTGICPICGDEYKQTALGTQHPRKQACSPMCNRKLVLLNNLSRDYRRVWTDDMDEFLRNNYPDNGSEFCAIELGLSRSSVSTHASKLGIQITQETKDRIVHGAAQTHMLNNNPMSNPETVARARQTRDELGINDKTYALLADARARIQRDKPSKVQLKLKDAMNAVGLFPQHEYIIKRKFVVDFAFVEENLIVEVDGCYWHGHECRFPKLTDRQSGQKRRDASRNKYLETCGWEILRIWECDINRSIDACVNTIKKCLT